MDKQTNRWSKGEMELMKKTFSGDKGEELLVEIRDVLMQFSDEVPELNKDVVALIRKMILPNLDKDLPIGFQADVYNVLAGTPDRAGIKDLHPEVALVHIKAQDMVYDYLKQRLDALEGKVVHYPISLLDLKNKINKTDDERLISMIAYLFLEGSYIEPSLIAIRNHANVKEETEEEKEKRLEMDSSK